MLVIPAEEETDLIFLAESFSYPRKQTASVRATGVLSAWLCGEKMSPNQSTALGRRHCFGVRGCCPLIYSSVCVSSRS